MTIELLHLCFETHNGIHLLYYTRYTGSATFISIIIGKISLWSDDPRFKGFSGTIVIFR